MAERRCVWVSHHRKVRFSYLVRSVLGCRVPGNGQTLETGGEHGTPRVLLVAAKPESAGVTGQAGRGRK